MTGTIPQSEILRAAGYHIPGRRFAIFLITLCAALAVTSCGKQAQPSPKPQPPPPFEFVDSWGDKGDGPGKLDQPTAFTIDTLGRVFFADPGSGFVHKYESKGTPLLSFEDPSLRRASGIAVDHGGAIYVADVERGTIRIFFPDGTFFKPIQFSPQSHFAGTLGFGVDEDGKLYVPDPAHSRIAKFDTQGRLMKSWQVPKEANPDERPMAVEPVKDDSVFVAFPKTGRIEKYSPDGMWVTSWVATDGLSGDSRSMSGFAVTDDFVFTLTDSPPHVRVWTLDGQRKVEADLGDHFAGTAAPATAPGTPATDAPVSDLQIAVTPQNELLVFDPTIPRVYRFKMHLETKE